MSAVEGGVSHASEVAVDSEERSLILHRGVEMLRAVEEELRQLLRPATSSDDASGLRFIREVMSFADRLELALSFDGPDLDSVYARDMMVLSATDPDSLRLLEELEHRRDELRPLRLLLVRYERHEFMPPKRWFGLNEQGA